MTKHLGYSYEMAIEIASRYNHKSEFMKDHLSLYKWAYNRGFWKEMSAHMPKRMFLTSKEEIIKIAQKYKKKSTFIKNEPAAYGVASRMGIVDEICKHMERNWLAHEDAVERKCSRCNTIKNVEEFAKTKTVKCGIISTCRKCMNEHSYEYARKNKDKKRALTAKRRAKRNLASPHWLTEDHFNEIKKFYSLAEAAFKDTGIKHDVDHIIPIGGENVCGLHVPWNLQVIPASKNRSKNNKFSQKDGRACSN